MYVVYYCLVLKFYAECTKSAVKTQTLRHIHTHTHTHIHFMKVFYS